MLRDAWEGIAVSVHGVKEDHPSLHPYQSAAKSYFAKLMNGVSGNNHLNDSNYCN